MDVSIKLDISRVIEEQESKLRQSINETIVYTNPLHINDLDKSISNFKDSIKQIKTDVKDDSIVNNRKHNYQYRGREGKEH